MRIVHLWLIVYALLVLGAVFALWQGGVLARLSPVWIAIALAIAAAFGVMLALSFRRPPIATPEE